MAASFLFDVPFSCKVKHYCLTEIKVDGLSARCELRMIEKLKALGQHRTLPYRLKKILAACAVSAAFAVGGLGPVIAGGETRSISLYHMHTGESLSVTYMKDGRYVPSAMKQINYLLRDWRRDKTITIDPRTIDLVWELHEDLGSHAPVHIVCGYRSAQTNALLHRMGRHVAKESQHIQGRAIDFYLTDVPTVKIRNVALVHQRGGVGYYRSAGGPTGFLHVDSGHVRHWGPYISSSQMAQIFRDGRKYVGRHMNGGGSFAPDTQVASADENSRQAPRGFLSKLLGLGKKEPVVVAPAPTQVAEVAPDANYKKSSQADLADLTADASTTPVKPKALTASMVSQSQMASLGDLSQDAATAPKLKLVPQQVAAADAADEADSADASDTQVNKGRTVPKPRVKPVEVMLMAAANMKPAPQMIRINAASAPPPSQTGRDKPSPVADSLGTLMEAVASDDVPVQSTKSKSLAVDLKNGTAKGAGVIRPMIASVGGDINWWPQLFLRNEAAVRRDGQPPLIGTLDQDALPKAASINNVGGGSSAYAADLSDVQHSAEGKGDLVSNEEDKVDLGFDLAKVAGKTAKN